MSKDRSGEQDVVALARRHLGALPGGPTFGVLVSGLFGTAAAALNGVARDRKSSDEERAKARALADSMMAASGHMLFSSMCGDAALVGPIMSKKARARGRRGKKRRMRAAKGGAR